MNHIVTLCSLCLFDCLSKKIKTVFYLAILLLSFILSYINLFHFVRIFWVDNFKYLQSTNEQYVY